MSQIMYESVWPADTWQADDIELMDMKYFISILTLKIVIGVA